LILSLPKVRSSFQFNNKTLIQCNENSIDLLIFVISKCSHSSIRQSIRRTWGNLKLLNQYFPKIKVKLLFIVDIDSQSDKKIELEYFYHNDIVQIVNLGEEYFYVTEREAALYQFVNEKCKQTKFVFKTDDDIFLNTFLLLLFLKDKLNNLIKYSLFGFPIEYGLVIRYSNDEVGKRYIITKDEYLCSRYPTFLSGFGYLMSIETSNLFFNSYLTDIKPFPLSDVYFTGLLSQMLNIKREIILENVDYHYQTTCNQIFFKLKTNPLVCAASNDHFNQKQTNKDKTLMNDYNLYWTILIERYGTFKIIKD